MDIGIVERARGASSVRRHAAKTFAASMLAVVAMVAGALWFVGTSVLHDRVLDRETYLSALDETGTYRRLYSDVLTDAAVRDLTGRLFDGLAEAGVDRQDAAAVANAALRLALPPAVLREAAEALVSNVLAYVRGDRTTFEAPVAVLDALRRVDPSAAVFVREAVSAMSSLLLDHLEEVEFFARTVADGLADGQIPAMVPLVGGRLVAEEQLMGVLDGLTATLVPADVRTELLAAMDSRERRDALIASALDAMHAWLEEMSRDLATGGDVHVDLVDALVLASGQDRAKVAASADSVRTLVGWAPSWSRYGGLALLIAGGAASARLQRRRTSRAVAAVGIGLVSAGAAVWSGWVLLSRAVGSPVIDAATANGRRELPAGAARLLADIDQAMLTSLRGSSTRPAMTLVLLGAAAVAIGVAAMVWAAIAPTARRRVVVAGALTVSASATLPVAVIVEPGPVHAERLCNGHAELCGRRYDEVVQAATHNSMSSPDVVRVWPEHDGNIREQLDFGIRMLMIDATYWDPLDITQLGSLRDLVNSDAAIAFIDKIETRLAPRPGIYLCHSQCAFGAISMTTALVQIKAFLDENPNEVVTLMIQDGIEPADTEAAFVESGIDELLFDHIPDGQWPTLGELIDRGQRLVVFSEQHVPPPAWYLSAFRHIQDTPYRARSPEQLSCALNRGPKDAPLFLLNNWIERQAPDRAQAAIVNAKGFIVERARRCEEERGTMPNFIAVSFYGIGDVLGAVDELNGLAPP